MEPEAVARVNLFKLRVRDEFARGNLNRQEHQALLTSLRRQANLTMTADEVKQLFNGLRPEVMLLFNDLIDHSAQTAA